METDRDLDELIGQGTFTQEQIASIERDRKVRFWGALTVGTVVGGIAVALFKSRRKESF